MKKLKRIFSAALVLFTVVSMCSSPAFAINRRGYQFGLSAEEGEVKTSPVIAGITTESGGIFVYAADGGHAEVPVHGDISCSDEAVYIIANEMDSVGTKAEVSAGKIEVTGSSGIEIDAIGSTANVMTDSITLYAKTPDNYVDPCGIRIAGQGTDSSVAVGEICAYADVEFDFDEYDVVGIAVNAKTGGKIKVNADRIESAGTGISAEVEDKAEFCVRTGDIMSARAGVYASAEAAGRIDVKTGDIVSEEVGMAILTHDSITKANTADKELPSGPAFAKADVENIKSGTTGMLITAEGTGSRSAVASGSIRSGKDGLNVYVSNGADAEIVIDGNVIAEDGAGIYVSSDEYSLADIIVTGEVVASEYAVMLKRVNSPVFTPDSFNIAVWKTTLADGKAVSVSGMTGEVKQSDEEASGQAEDALLYILKVMQPEGVTVTLADADGNSLDERGNYPVAHAGDRIFVKAEAEEGFEITDVLIGTEDRESLECGEGGVYSFVVPRGGGVLISVETEEDN